MRAATDRATQAGDASSPVELRLEQHRVELTAYCYRILGSVFEAEDAVQETLTRAWRNFDRFEGRSALRTWLYSIASNVCFDMLKASQRRARPMDLGAAATADGPIGEPLHEATWIEPAPDGLVVADGADPAELAVARESIRLAFVAALQHLPPRQRAVLILREVLRWEASEVAELLDTTVASVNSALQRARSTIEAGNLVPAEAAQPMDDEQQALLARYVDAFQIYDMESLTSLLHEDATQSMPPYELWLHGREDMLRWWVGPGAACRGSRLIPTAANGSPAYGQYRPSGPGGSYELWLHGREDMLRWWVGPGAACRGSRLIPTAANGSPAYGQYRPSGPGGSFEPWSLQVLEVSDGRIVEITFFLDTERLFPLFGLPPTIDA